MEGNGNDPQAMQGQGNTVGESQQTVQERAEIAANAAIDSLKQDPTSRLPTVDPNRDRDRGYRAPTVAELRAREQKAAREHPFIVAVKALLDALAPEPKLGAVESTYTAVRREYNELTGVADARAVVTGAGSEHESLRDTDSPESAD